MVRDRAHGLDPEKKYIICCDTGRRSAAAAFLLSQRGLDVCVLEGGMNNSIPADLPGTTTATRDAENIKPDKVTTATSGTRKPAKNNNSTAGYMAKLKTLQKERDAAREESRTIRSQLAELQQEMSALQTCMVGYMSKSMQLEAALQDDKQARAALSDLINKLAD
jgi:hypothetical protein